MQSITIQSNLRCSISRTACLSIHAPVERVEQIARRGFKAEVKRLFSRNVGQVIGGQRGHGGFAEPELHAGMERECRDARNAAKFGDRFGGGVDRQRRRPSRGEHRDLFRQEMVVVGVGDQQRVDRSTGDAEPLQIPQPGDAAVDQDMAVEQRAGAATHALLAEAVPIVVGGAGSEQFQVQCGRSLFVHFQISLLAEAITIQPDQENCKRQRGASALRSPSPVKLKASTAMKRARPGNRVRCQ